MAQLDKLIDKMKQRGVQRAVLVPNQPIVLYVGKERASAPALTEEQIRSMLAEVAPRAFTTQAVTFQFLHKALSGGPASVTVSEDVGELNVIISIEAEQVAAAVAQGRPCWFCGGVPALRSQFTLIWNNNVTSELGNRIPYFKTVSEPSQPAQVPLFLPRCSKCKAAHGGHCPSGHSCEPLTYDTVFDYVAHELTRSGYKPTRDTNPKAVEEYFADRMLIPVGDGYVGPLGLSDFTRKLTSGLREEAVEQAAPTPNTPAQNIAALGCLAFFVLPPLFFLGNGIIDFIKYAIRYVNQ